MGSRPSCLAYRAPNADQEIVTEQVHSMQHVELVSILQSENQPEKQYPTYELVTKGRLRKQYLTLQQGDDQTRSEQHPKSNILSSMVSRVDAAQQLNVDFIVPENVTLVLLRMEQQENEERLVKMFSDCKKSAPMELEDGSVFEGQRSHGILNGFGRRLYKDGSYYEGFWVNNERHFFGRFVGTDGVGYSGQWFAEKMHGKGKYYYQDNSVIEVCQSLTEKLLKLKESQPSKEYESGAKFYGAPQMGLLVHPDGTECYGSFKDDLLQGYGIQVSPNGQRYEGLWEKGKRHGLGIFTEPNGGIYLGLYENDQKEGYGMYQWPDGHKYRGQFTENHMTGIGRSSTIKGITIEADWENGKRMKDGHRHHHHHHKHKHRKAPEAGMEQI